MKKKICMIVQNPMVKGGIAAVVNGYRDSQLEKDFDIIYVESYQDGGKLGKFFKAIRGYIHYIKVLIIDKPDLVHIHSSFGPSFYRKIPFINIAHWFGKPIINHIHGSDFDTFYFKASNKKKKLIEKMYLKCSAIIALSDAGMEQISKIVSTQKIVIIENFSLVHMDALLERQKRSSNNTVLYLGEIGKRKGCYDIPSVVEEVAKKIPDVRFILGGAGEVEKIKKLLNDKGMQKYVEFPGWVRGDQKDRLLREADVFLLPSYNEGMPMSILDAMGYGLPIVSTNVGGISKIVHDGNNGYLCQAGDIIGLSEAIIELLQDVELLKTFGERSCSIANEYSLDTHLMRLKSLYNNM